MCETLSFDFVASSVAWNITNIGIYDKIMWSRSIYVMKNGNTSELLTLRQRKVIPRYFKPIKSESIIPSANFLYHCFISEYYSPFVNNFIAHYSEKYPHDLRIPRDQFVICLKTPMWTQPYDLRRNLRFLHFLNKILNILSRACVNCRACCEDTHKHLSRQLRMFLP